MFSVSKFIFSFIAIFAIIFSFEQAVIDNNAIAKSIAYYCLDGHCNGMYCSADASIVLDDCSTYLAITCGRCMDYKYSPELVCTPVNMNQYCLLPNGTKYYGNPF